jgi:glutathione S-transferase/RNA polymerase-associated protein
MKLFEHPLSPYAQKVKISLYEKGVEFETTIPNIGGPDPAFEAVSPRREVPCLVDGPLEVFDSTIILEYLEDKFPTPAMLPSGAAERARVRMIEELCDTYYEAINWAMFELQAFRRATGAKAEELTTRAKQQTAGVHARLERDLGTRPWFNGDAFGWGDLSVIPYVAASVGFGFAPPAGSKLAAWVGRVRERPSVARTLREADEMLPVMSQVAALVESGAFVREYRDHRLEWMMRSGGVDIVLDGMKRNNIRFSVELG